MLDSKEGEIAQSQTKKGNGKRVIRKKVEILAEIFQIIQFLKQDSLENIIYKSIPDPKLSRFTQ